MSELDRTANRTPRFTVRALEESETDAALRLVWNVFVEFEAPDYGREGVDEFQKCLNDAGFLENPNDARLDAMNEAEFPTDAEAIGKLDLIEF